MNTINYVIHESNNAKTHCFYTQAITKGMISYEELIEYISKELSIKEPIIEAAIKLTIEYIKNNVSNGMSCEFGKNFIQFYPVVNCSAKDYTDDNKNRIIASENMINDEICNIKPNIGCKISSKFQKTFGKNIILNKI